jgi:hypothetical protein
MICDFRAILTILFSMACTWQPRFAIPVKSISMVILEQVWWFSTSCRRAAGQESLHSEFKNEAK